MSSRSSLPGSHFSGFPCHHSSLAGICAPDLRLAHASRILTALGPPPGPRAAAAGAASGAQLLDPRATQNPASSSTRPCQRRVLLESKRQRGRFALLATPPETLLPGLQCPVRPLTQGEGREQGQGAGAAARGGPGHQPCCGAAQPLDEPPASSCAPFPSRERPTGCLETNARSQQEAKLLPRLAPGLPRGQTPRAGGREVRRVSPGGGSFLFILTPVAHTPPTGRRTRLR